jgi:hypothetical protein
MHRDPDHRAGARAVRRGGWPWFAAWAVAGGLALFAVVDAIGVGLLIAPVALVGIWMVSRRARLWPEIAGVISGTGAVSLVFAFANRGYEGACYPGIVLGSGGRTSCGGVPPLPWLVVGIVLAIGGMLLYSFAQRSAAKPVRGAPSVTAA